ncbi:Plastocyanin [uncultured archaeon]|nr:Plastocyanin [uncultured archaeon]
MKRGWLIGVGIILILVLLVGGFYLYKPKEIPAQNLTGAFSPNVPSIPSPPSVPSSPTTSHVEISNFAFSPQTVNVHVGDTVSWLNKDSVMHSIIWDSQGPTNSSTFSNGQIYSYTFNVAGTYSYHCGIHTSMKGVVVVS